MLAKLRHYKREFDIEHHKPSEFPSTDGRKVRGDIRGYKILSPNQLDKLRKLFHNCGGLEFQLDVKRSMLLWGQ